MNRIRNKKNRDNCIRTGCFLVIGFLVLLSMEVWGQTRTFYEHGHRIEHYTYQDGLPSSHIGGLYQDKKGYLWISSSAGLLKSDGYAYERVHFDRNLITYTVQDHLAFLTGDRSDNLWISTGGGHIRYNQKENTFKRFATGNRVKDNANNAVEDTLGSVWYGALSGLHQVTLEDSLISYDIKRVEQLLNPLLDSLKNESSFYHENINLHKGQTLKQPFELKEQREITVVCNSQIDENLELLDYGWIENDKGDKVWEIDLSKSKNTGGWYFIHRTNIDFISLDAGKYNLVFTKSEKDSPNLYELFESPERIKMDNPKLPKWQGIIVCESNSQMHNEINRIEDQYSRIVGLPDAFDYALFKDKLGEIWWFSTHFLGKIIRDGERISFETVFSPFDKGKAYLGDISNMAEKDAKHLFIAGRREDIEGNREVFVGVFNKETFEFKEIKTGLPSNNSDYHFISELALDKKGNLWLGTLGNGLFKLSPPFVSVNSSKSPNVSRFYFGYTKKYEGFSGDPREIYCHILDANENLWIGTRNDGLYKIDLAQANYNLTDLGSVVKETRLLNIEEDKLGTIWIGTSTKGLLQINSKTNEIIQHVSTFKGSPFESSIAPILILPNNNILFGTTTELWEYNPKEDTIINKVAKLFSGNTPLYYSGFSINDSLAFLPPGYIINTKNWTIFQKFNSFLGGFSFSNGLKSKEGAFWLAAIYGSIAKFVINENGLDTLTLFDSDYNIAGIIEDKEGNIWTPSKYGLQKFSAGNKQPITYSLEGTNLSTLRGNLESDSEGNIWIFTPSEVVKFDIVKKTFEIIHRLKDIDILNAGLPHLKKNISNTFRILGTKGLFSFQPDSLSIDTIPPKVIIERLNYIDNNENKTILCQLRVKSN